MSTTETKELRLTSKQLWHLDQHFLIHINRDRHEFSGIIKEDTKELLELSDIKNFLSKSTLNVFCMAIAYEIPKAAWLEHRQWFLDLALSSVTEETIYDLDTTGFRYDGEGDVDSLLEEFHEMLEYHSYRPDYILEHLFSVCGAEAIHHKLMEISTGRFDEENDVYKVTPQFRKDFQVDSMANDGLVSDEDKKRALKLGDDDIRAFYKRLVEISEQDYDVFDVQNEIKTFQSKTRQGFYLLHSSDAPSFRLSISGYRPKVTTNLFFNPLGTEEPLFYKEYDFKTLGGTNHDQS